MAKGGRVKSSDGSMEDVSRLTAAAQARGAPAAGAGDEAPQTEDKFTLNIYFEGLCVFVPGPNCDVMRVLIVNSCGGHSGAAHAMGSIPPHVPFVQVVWDEIQIPPARHAAEDGSSKGPNDTGQWDVILPNDPDLNADATAIYFLEWQDISIPPEPQINDLKIVRGRIPGSQEPDYQGKGGHDFSWVAELEKAAPGSGDLDPRCFDRDPPRELVIARMRLPTGSIRVERIVETNRSVIWEFKGSNSGMSSGYSQALASRIKYWTTIYAPSVTLHLEPFRDGDERVDLVLAPSENTRRSRRAATAEAIREVNVWIGNLPLAEMISLQLEDYPPSSSQTHFMLPYRLSLQPPADPPLPAPISHPGNQRAVGGARGGSLICAGTTANPHEAA